MTPPSGSVNVSSPSDHNLNHTVARMTPSSPPPTKSSAKMASTPSSNYAAPHTPIASAKRPRSHNSAIKSTGKNTANGRRSRSSIGTSNHTYGREIVNHATTNAAETSTVATSSTSSVPSSVSNAMHDHPLSSLCVC